MTRASESPITRRGVLGAAAGLAAITIVPRHVLGGAGRVAPSETPCLGGVGIGGVGRGQIQQCAAAGFKVVALCDVDDKLAERTAEKFPQARRYRDFRRMLADEGGKIDAVYCGTPDHTHATVSMAALKAGKHTLTVKPLTRTCASQTPPPPTSFSNPTTRTDGIWKHEGNEIEYGCGVQ